MKKIVLTLLASIIMGMTHAEESVVIDPIKHFRQGELMNYNPSLYPVSNDYVTVHCPERYLERYRILCDVNGDGIDDLILSDRLSLFGKSDGPWSVYVSTNSLWKYIGMLGFHHRRFLIERTWDGVNVWSSGYSSASIGTVGYSRIANGKVDDCAGNMIVQSQEGDVETSVCSRINTAIFDYSGNHPFRLEVSETSANGIVSWKFVRDHHRAERPTAIQELMQKLADERKKVSEIEKRAIETESELAKLSARLCQYESNVMGICGVTLGSKWKDGELNRPCEEIFSGFTNMTVKLDADGFVKRIRLARKEDKATLDAVRDATNAKPAPGEQKTIHEIENYFHIRLEAMPNAHLPKEEARRLRGYFWGNVLTICSVEVLFANGYTAESFIDMIYSRDYMRIPGDKE